MRYRVSAWFVCHDVKLSDLAVAEVEGRRPPTPRAALDLLWPVAVAIVERQLGDTGYRIDWTSEPQVEPTG